MRPVRAFIWAKWWVIGWPILLVVQVALAAWLEWWWWVPLAIVTFLAPEIYAVARQPSATPPLTSIIRRYVPAWAAFPILAGATGFVTTALVTDRAGLSIAIFLGSAVAGWGIEHFMTTMFQLKRKSRR